jgi:hypothetical protein
MFFFVSFVFRFFVMKPFALWSQGETRGKGYGPFSYRPPRPWPANGDASF